MTLVRAVRALAPVARRSARVALPAILLPGLLLAGCGGAAGGSRAGAADQDRLDRISAQVVAQAQGRGKVVCAQVGVDGEGSRYPGTFVVLVYVDSTDRAELTSAALGVMELLWDSGVPDLRYGNLAARSVDESVRVSGPALFGGQDAVLRPVRLEKLFGPRPDPLPAAPEAGTVASPAPCAGAPRVAPS